MTILEKLEVHKDDILRRYGLGESTTSLANEYEVNSYYVYQIVKKHGKIREKKVKRGDNDKYKDEIYKMFEAGNSACSIAKILGISKPFVLRSLKDAGFDTSIRSTARKRPLTYDASKIVEFYQYGLSSNKIAEIFTTDVTHIRRILRENNVELLDSRIKYNVDETFFKIIDTQEKAYCLGLWYSDGTVDLRGLARLYLKVEDIELLENVAKVLKFNGKVYTGVYSEYGTEMACLPICRVSFCADLARLGCVPNKSLFVQFPTNDIVPDDLLRHFVRGYFCGNGTITENYCSFATNRYFATGLSDVLSQLGIESKIYYRKDKHEDIASLFINKKADRCKLYLWMYKHSTLSLPRKRDFYFESFVRMMGGT